MLLQNCPFVGQLIIYCKGQKISRIATLQDSSRDPARHSESAGLIAAASSCRGGFQGQFFTIMQAYREIDFGTLISLYELPDKWATAL